VWQTVRPLSTQSEQVPAAGAVSGFTVGVDPLVDRNLSLGVDTRRSRQSAGRPASNCCRPWADVDPDLPSFATADARDSLDTPIEAGLGANLNYATDLSFKLS
jgi:hypothetical protein